MIEENDILEIRKGEIENPSIREKISSLEKATRDLFTKYLDDSQIRKQGQQMNESGFRTYQLQVLGDKEATAAYLLKREKFALGKNLSAAEESQLIDERRSQLATAIPYLKTKLRGSLFANLLLKKLSPQQSSELTALLLQLRGNNIPTEQDLVLLKAKLKTATEGPSESEIDYAQYKLLHEQLMDLRLHLENQRKLGASH